MSSCALLVEFEFDVVRRKRVDVEFAAEVLAQKIASGVRGGDGGFKVGRHGDKCSRETPFVARVLVGAGGASGAERERKNQGEKTRDVFSP